MRACIMLQFHIQETPHNISRVGWNQFSETITVIDDIYMRTRWMNDNTFFSSDTLALHDKNPAPW